MRIMLQYDHSRANIYFKMKLSSFEINYLNFCVWKGMTVSVYLTGRCSRPVSTTGSACARILGARPPQMPSARGPSPIGQDPRGPPGRRGAWGGPRASWGRAGPPEWPGSVFSLYLGSPGSRHSGCPELPHGAPEQPGGMGAQYRQGAGGAGQHAPRSPGSTVSAVCSGSSVWRNRSDTPPRPLNSRVEPLRCGLRRQEWVLGMKGGSSHPARHRPPRPGVCVACLRPTLQVPGLPPVAVAPTAALGLLQTHGCTPNP